MHSRARDVARAQAISSTLARRERFQWPRGGQAHCRWRAPARPPVHRLRRRAGVGPGRGVVQSYADADYCLASRGDVGKGVGIWECDSVTGDHGQNLKFTVAPDGVIRPAIAIETGVSPAGGDAVALRPLDGGAAQRWRAGAR